MKILGRAEQVMPLVKGPSVLHVGCAAHAPCPGDPSWLHGSLCKRFPDTVGIDLRPDLIEQLQSLGFRNLYVANAETFELNQQFETIVAGDVVEHLSNAGSFLRQARKHLAPDGEIIVTTPFPGNKIPAAQIDPSAAKVQALFPAPKRTCRASSPRSCS